MRLGDQKECNTRDKSSKMKRSEEDRTGSLQRGLLSNKVEDKVEGIQSYINQTHQSVRIDKTVNKIMEKTERAK